MAQKPTGLWIVQLLEYAIGFAIASTAAHAQRPYILIALALIVIANAACVQGPLSAFRMTTANTHRILGIAIAALLIACAIFIPLSVNDKITLIAAAGAEGFVSVRFGHGF